MNAAIMFWRTTASIAMMLVGASALFAAPPADVPKEPVSCPKVIAYSDRLSTEIPSKSHDPLYISRKLHSHPFWVERCLLAYGRRVSRHVQIDDETRYKLEKQWESWPPGQVGSQEAEKDVPWRRARRDRGALDLEKPEKPAD
jgi:hypothetical protein